MRIFVVIGKDGTQKEDILKSLISFRPNLKRLVVYTTNQNELCYSNDRTHMFVSEHSLDMLRVDRRVIESHYYDTSFGRLTYATVLDNQFIEPPLHQDFILINDLSGYNGLRMYFAFNPDIDVIPIYVCRDDSKRLTYNIEKIREMCSIVPIGTSNIEKGKKYHDMCERFLTETKTFSDDNLRICGITDKNTFNLDKGLPMTVDDIITRLNL